MAKCPLTKIIEKNLANSGIARSWGSMESLGCYFCSEDGPLNFIISGGGANMDDKHVPINSFLRNYMGTEPVIIIHNNNVNIENSVYDIWNSLELDGVSPLWILNKESPGYEPFCNMNDNEIVEAFRSLAVKLGYQPSAAFDRVVRSHIEILRSMKSPVSLKGLAALSAVENADRLWDIVMNLPCEEYKRSSIWTGLGIGSGEIEQLELFRSVVESFAEELSRGSWSRDGEFKGYNCIGAVSEKAVMLLSVNSADSKLFMSYLSKELKSCGCDEYIIIFDNPYFSDKNITDYLRRARNCVCGIKADDILTCFESKEEFQQFCEKINTFVFFKHGTYVTAEQLSQIMGSAEFIREERSSGIAQGFFRLLPSHRHHETQYRIEDRYRVMPENIMDLKPGNAIVFEALNNGIIYFH